MFIIAKGVAEGIRALGTREDVQRELDAIRAMPGLDVYVNAIAEAMADAGTSQEEVRAPRHGKPADPPK